VAYAINKLNYKLENIILWGFSLGSGPSVDFASRYPNLGGLILEAPLASIYILMDSEATKDYNDADGDIFGNIYKI
jgi:pimeloyl-ACP methyl ester carboxylesterase